MRTLVMVALACSPVAQGRGAEPPLTGRWPVDWQYRVPLPGGSGTAVAYLWLPPATKTVRGLLLGGEAEYLVSRPVRQACVDNDLGVVVFRAYVGGRVVSYDGEKVVFSDAIR